MTAAFLALLIAGGAAVWIYTKLQNKTGYGNNTGAAKGAGVAFAIIFVVVFTIGNMLLK